MNEWLNVYLLLSPLSICKSVFFLFIFLIDVSLLFRCRISLLSFNFSIYLKWIQICLSFVALKSLFKGFNLNIVCFLNPFWNRLPYVPMSPCSYVRVTTKIIIHPSTRFHWRTERWTDIDKHWETFWKLKNHYNNN